jgi:hypothetical protein
MVTGCGATISFRCEFILNMFQDSLHRSVILLNNLKISLCSPWSVVFVVFWKKVTKATTEAQPTQRIFRNCIYGI